MPKKIVGAIVVILLLLTLGLLGCGSGDKGPVVGENPFTGEGVGPGGGGGGGGGGGAAGACEVTFMSVTSCWSGPGLTQSVCQQIASSSGGTSAFHSGTTCSSLGYTTNCVSQMGYEVCQK